MLATPQLNRLPATERGITLGDFLVPIRIGERMSARLRHIALICVGAVFIALTANVAFRLPDNPVPVTGQTLSVLVVGGALGLRRGVLSVGLYLALGLFLPVYANQAPRPGHDRRASARAAWLSRRWAAIWSASCSPRPWSAGWRRTAGTATSAAPSGR